MKKVLSQKQSLRAAGLNFGNYSAVSDCLFAPTLARHQPHQQIQQTSTDASPARPADKTVKDRLMG